jgi:hypothetical protein
MRLHQPRWSQHQIGLASNSSTVQTWSVSPDAIAGKALVEIL